MSELLSQTDAQKKTKRKGFSHVAFSGGMLLGVGLAALFVVQQPVTEVIPDSDQNPALSHTVSLIEQALQQVSSDYIDEIPPEELANAALSGMFTKLDKHSHYLDEVTYQQLLEQTDGEFLGLGIEVNELDSHVKIISLIDQSPAARIGLQIGDEILAINGQSILDQPYKELLGAIRSQIGSSVSLSIQRNDEILDVTLIRDIIPIHSVKSVFIAAPDNDPANRNLSTDVATEGVAYVRITHFNEHTANDLEKILIELQNSPQALYGLILDLRNNPGGLVTSAVEVADLFLQSGTIVSATGRAVDADFKYQAQTGELFAELPLMILINGSTASAAEIVAAALKEQDRATLLGENSYGKGLVQTIIPLSAGALKLTTSRYYTPSGLSINERGIRPQIKIADSDMIMAVAELQNSTIPTLPIHLAIKDPALLRAWQQLNRVTARDQLAMDTKKLNNDESKTN